MVEVLHRRLRLPVARHERPLQQRASHRAVLLKAPAQRSVAVVDAAAVGARVDDRGEALWLAGEQAERGAPAHRMRDEVHLRDAEVVEQRPHVRAEGDAAGALSGVGGTAEGAVVEGDGRVALREGRHLLPPRHAVAAGAVRQQHGRRGRRRVRPVDLVVELEAFIEREARHA